MPHPFNDKGLITPKAEVFTDVCQTQPAIKSMSYLDVSEFLYEEFIKNRSFFEFLKTESFGSTMDIQKLLQRYAFGCIYLRREHRGYVNLLGGYFKETKTGGVEWSSPYEDRLLEAILSLLTYLDFKLTDKHIEILKDCINNKQDKYYKVYNIPKKSGGFRQIEEPCEELKEIQNTILHKYIYKVFLAHTCAFGFIPKKSIYKAARYATRLSFRFGDATRATDKVLLKIDLKDFFPSITQESVLGSLWRLMSYRWSKPTWCFWPDIINEFQTRINTIVSSHQRKRFIKKYIIRQNLFKEGGDTISVVYLNNESQRPDRTVDSSDTLKDLNLANLAFGRQLHLLAAITHIACYKGRLPQGSPLSPYLSNLYMQKADEALRKRCAVLSASYVRYADDICAVTDSVESALYLKTRIVDILRKNASDVQINKKKVKILRHGKPMRVVGININHYPSISRYKRKQIEAMMFNIVKGKQRYSAEVMKKISGYRALLLMTRQWSAYYQSLYTAMKKMA